MELLNQYYFNAKVIIRESFKIRLIKERLLTLGTIIHTFKIRLKNHQMTDEVIIKNVVIFEWIHYTAGVKFRLHWNH